MVPTLRSNTTPNGKTGIETTPTKSPRKVPRCTKCQRPRAGHPRQGCPFTQSPHHSAQPVHQDLSASMDSLVISPRKTKLNGRRRPPPAHEITLASLSTESSNILNRLIQPENTCEDLSLAGRNVGMGPTPEHQQNPSASSRPPFKEGRIMPGTLVTPAPSFLTEMAPPQPDCHFDSKASIAMPPAMGTPPRLARSMSMEERTTFLDGLSELSRGPPATVYSIHVLELQHMAESAKKLGFHTGVVLPKTGPRDEGLLVLGRDVRAVEDLAARLSQDSPKQSGVRAIAGGLVAGAVATFTGLALA